MTIVIKADEASNTLLSMVESVNKHQPIQIELDLAEEIYMRLKKIEFNPEQGECLKPKPPSRCYVDGAFDLVHAGHFNAIRQASLLCDELVVGVNSTEEVEAVKGPGVLS